MRHLDLGVEAEAADKVEEEEQEAFFFLRSCCRGDGGVVIAPWSVVVVVVAVDSGWKASSIGRSSGGVRGEDEEEE